MKIVKIFLKLIKNIVLFILILAITILSVQQIQTELYNFPSPKSFQGDYLYNPYNNLKGKWYKGNFHAHSIVIKNVLNGKDTPEEVINHYESRNYDIIGLSNYHHIASKDFYKNKVYIPVYEHGYNIMKSHRLVIGPEEVSFFDCLINYSLSNKQYIVSRLKSECEALAIAHPKFRNGHTIDDFKYLTGYDLIEVLNHYRFSFEHWDAALSSGIPAWIISDDDTHNVKRAEETCVNWTMINSDKLDRKSIIENLKQGRALGVTGKEGENKNHLDSVIVNDQTVTFKFVNTADEINLVGNNGEQKLQIKNTSEVSYKFKPSDTYIRAEVINGETKMYLNPIVRYDGTNIPVNEMKAEVNIPLTYLMRAGIIAFYLVCFYFWVKRRIKKSK